MHESPTLHYAYADLAVLKDFEESVFFHILHFFPINGKTEAKWKKSKQTSSLIISPSHCKMTSLEQYAATAISQLNGYRIEHKVLKVAYSRKSDEEIKGSKLYLQKLPPQYTEEEIANYFQSYGNAVQVRVVTDKATGQSKGIGFILFSKRAEAEAALADLDNKIPPGGTQPMRIKFADDNAKKVKAPSQYNYYTQPPYPVHGGYGEGMGGSRGPMRNPGGRFRFNPMGNSGAYGGGYGGGSTSYGADYYSPPSQGGGY
uniref:RRM domain-containing protein n=2 Tax=Magallana gigas TaxID=29159 RepID=A0A8W8LAX8_MAGGI